MVQFQRPPVAAPPMTSVLTMPNGISISRHPGMQVPNAIVAHRPPMLAPQMPNLPRNPVTVNISPASIRALVSFYISTAAARFVSSSLASWVNSTAVARKQGIL
jgi:hypothetical protein